MVLLCSESESFFSFLFGLVWFDLEKHLILDYYLSLSLSRSYTRAFLSLLSPISPLPGSSFVLTQGNTIGSVSPCLTFLIFLSLWISFPGMPYPGQDR